jgi:hypothetical protein
MEDLERDLEVKKKGQSLKTPWCGATDHFGKHEKNMLNYL